MINEETTTIPDQGSPEGTGSQPTEPISQETAQPELTGQRQVETMESQPTSQPQKREVSNFYRDRQKIRNLENLVKEMNSKIQQLSNPQQKPIEAKPVPTEADFYKDPLGTMTQVMKDLARQETESIKKSFAEEQTQAQKAKASQEVEKMILAKSKEFNDPNFFDNLAEIVDNYGLSHWAEKDPVAATKAAINLYSEKKGNGIQRTPLVATKAAMASTASGTPPTAQTPSIADAQKLFDELQKDPSLANDEGFMKRWNTIKSHLEKK